MVFTTFSTLLIASYVLITLLVRSGPDLSFAAYKKPPVLRCLSEEWPEHDEQLSSRASS